MAYDPDEMELDPELVELAAGNKTPEEEEEELRLQALEKEEQEKAEKKKEEPKTKCFVSQKEVLLADTIELPYREQKVRVAKNLVKFPL